MGVYSMQSVNESTNYLDDVEFVDNGIEDVMESALRNIYEADLNHHNMMKDIGIAELAVYEQTGQEVVYEAGAARGVFERIKAGLKKIWEKIKSLFTKFIAKIQSYGKDDKAFVTKYKKQILAGEIGDLKVKGFKYEVDALSADGAWANMKKNTMLGDLETDLGTSKKNNSKFIVTGGGTTQKHYFGSDSEEEFNDKLRGACFDSSKGELTQSELQKELYELFRGGESKPIQLDKSDIDKNEMMKFLNGSKDAENKMNKDMESLKRTINNLITQVDKASREFEKRKSTTDDELNEDSRSIKFFTQASSAFNRALSICQLVAAARMKAFNGKRIQSKSICTKLIGRKAKNEGYEYDEEDNVQSYGESALDAIFANTKLI